jgi:nucleotide-binding universal stress UspA family protein
VVTSESAAYVEILKHAAALDSELIVMGIQGRGAIDRMVFGSNTARVTRASTCPVMIVPSHESARLASTNAAGSNSTR